MPLDFWFCIEVCSRRIQCEQKILVIRVTKAYVRSFADCYTKVCKNDFVFVLFLIKLDKNMLNCFILLFYRTKCLF